MAQTAIEIMPDGQRRKVNISDLTEDDLQKCNSYVCTGILDDGQVCNAPMLPFLGSKHRDGYFYEKSRKTPHLHDCPEARSRKATTVEMLDRRAQGKTNEALYDQLNQDKKPRGKKPPINPPIPDPEDFELDTPPYDETDDEQEKEIKARLRMPRNIQEFISLLSSLSIHDNYTNKKVFDLILDHRTVESYRRMGLPTNRPFVINARRTFPYEHGIALGNHQWILVDYWATGKHKSNPIVFLLDVTPEAQAKLVNLCRIEPSVKITLYVRLHRHPTLPRTYTSDLVKPQMIAASFDD